MTWLRNTLGRVACKALGHRDDAIRPRHSTGWCKTCRQVVVRCVDDVVETAPPWFQGRDW